MEYLVLLVGSPIYYRSITECVSEVFVTWLEELLLWLIIEFMFPHQCFLAHSLFGSSAICGPLLYLIYILLFCTIHNLSVSRGNVMAEVNSTAEQPFVLILVGLPGSGKSHFASRLEEKSARFVRINQDVLGDRPACEKLARSVLADGKIAVIDRCNFDVKQKKKWVHIANEKGV